MYILGVSQQSARLRVNGITHQLDALEIYHLSLKHALWRSLYLTNLTYYTYLDLLEMFGRQKKYQLDQLGDLLGCLHNILFEKKTPKSKWWCKMVIYPMAESFKKSPLTNTSSNKMINLMVERDPTQTSPKKSVKDKSKLCGFSIFFAGRI